MLASFLSNGTYSKTLDIPVRPERSEAESKDVRMPSLPRFSGYVPVRPASMSKAAATSSRV